MQLSSRGGIRIRGQKHIDTPKQFLLEAIISREMIFVSRLGFSNLIQKKKKTRRRIISFWPQKKNQQNICTWFMAPVMDCNVVVRAQHAVRQPLSYSTDRFLHWMPEKCSQFFFPPPYVFSPNQSWGSTINSSQTTRQTGRIFWSLISER